MTVHPTNPTSNASPIPTAEPLLVDEKTAAKLCGVSRTTFRTWVKAGLVQPLRLPSLAGDGPLRRNLYARGDIAAFLQSTKGAA